MPTSRARAKRPSSLSGVPGDVLKLAPQGWPDQKRAQWCRCFMDGHDGRPYRRPDQDRLDALPPYARMKAAEFGVSWGRTAHMQGRRAAGLTGWA
jgi:hypothetical protein